MKFHGVADVMGNPDIGIVVLHDKDERFLLPMVCSASMKEEISLRMKGDKFCAHMLPEVVLPYFMKAYGDNISIVINELVDGNYLAVVLGLGDDAMPTIYAVDAVMMHIISKVPIYITDSLLRKQAVPYVKGSPAMALPLNVLTPKMLKDALDHAVRVEDYEMASKFRDELKSREH